MVTEIIRKVITNVLTALYQPFLFAVLLSVLVLFFYMYAYEVPDGRTAPLGWKGAVRSLWRNVRAKPFYRRLFLLSMVTAMILFRTLLNRNLWLNPLSDVLGTWWIYTEDGELTTECIENVVLMLPFIALLFWTFGGKLLKKDTPGCIVWTAVRISFLFSLLIEFLQLFLRVGTFQISDLAFNTLGGLLGGLLYWVCRRGMRSV